jgi:menaquinone-dependent protoporphyrinogen oxidase
MKTLILYATKSGASQYCADLLIKQIENCTVCNLSKTAPDIAPFDTIIIGSGVRMGKFYKPVLDFLRENEDLLMKKKIAFYLCNAYPDTLQKIIDKSIPQQLAKAAICINFFGGKPILRASSGTDWLIEENVNAFVRAIR